MTNLRNLRNEIQSGKKVCGTMFRMEHSPAAAYLVKNAGLDFFMLDCEHGNYDFETVHDMAVAANALGVLAFARVPEGTKAYISRFLDMGITGVMVPMVETPEQAGNLVKWSKYPPLGGRGYTTTGPHTDFCTEPRHKEIMEEANGRILAIAQIETGLGVKNADAIAAVEGIDVLLIGPNDLSCSLGIPGNLFNPVELEAIARVAEACHRHGKLFALHASQKMQEKFVDDIDFYMQGTDQDMLLGALKSVRTAADMLLEKKL